MSTALRAAFLVLMLGSSAVAAPAWSTLPFPYDGAGLVGTSRAEVDPAGDLGVRLDLTYVRRPLRINSYESISDALELRLGMSLGLWRRRIQLGVVAPISVFVYQSDPEPSWWGEKPPRTVPAWDIASDELRVYLKFGLLDRRIVRLALSAAAVGPVGPERFHSDGTWGAEFRLALDVRVRWLTIVANLGGRARPVNYSVGVGSEMTWAFGLEAAIHRRAALAAEAFGVALSEAGRTYSPTIAVALSSRVELQPGLSLTLGLARSVLSSAFRGDDVRATVGIAWHPRIGVNELRVVAVPTR